MANQAQYCKSGQGSRKAKLKEAPKAQKSKVVVPDPTKASKENPTSQTEETTSSIPTTEPATILPTEPALEDHAKAPAYTPAPKE